MLHAGERRLKRSHLKRSASHAVERGHDEQAELALYVIHGLLHLCEFDDTTADAVRKMRERERHCLQLLGLPPIADSPG